MERDLEIKTIDMFQLLMFGIFSLSFLSCGQEKCTFSENNSLKIIALQNDTLPIICNVTRDIISDSLDIKLLHTLDEVRNSIENRNFDDFIKLLDENIIVSHGEALSGKNDFIEFWDEKSQRDQFWKSLSLIFREGGTYDTYNEQQAYIFPYFQSSDYSEKIGLDCFEFGIILGEKVELVDNKSQLVKKLLSGDVVQIMDRSETMLKVKLCCSDNEGWVKMESVYLCTDYILKLIKSPNGDWKIKVFSQG